MLAIAQSGYTYHYLNWTPSEIGPIVTHFGKIKKEIETLEEFIQNHYEILAEIISTIDNEEPICTYSLDTENLIFFTKMKITVTLWNKLILSKFKLTNLC